MWLVSFYMEWNNELRRATAQFRVKKKKKGSHPHLEVTKWDLHQPLLDIIAVLFYMRWKRWRRRSSQRAEWLWELKRRRKKIWLLICAFYGNSWQTSLDNPLAARVLMTIRCIWFPSCKKKSLHEHAHAYINEYFCTCANIPTLGYAAWTLAMTQTSTVFSLYCKIIHTYIHPLQLASGTNQIAAVHSQADSCFPVSLHPCTSGSFPVLQ